MNRTETIEKDKIENDLSRKKIIIKDEENLKSLGEKNINKVINIKKIIDRNETLLFKFIFFNFLNDFQIKIIFFNYLRIYFLKKLRITSIKYIKKKKL